MKIFNDGPTFAAWHWSHAARSLTILEGQWLSALVEGIEDAEEYIHGLRGEREICMHTVCFFQVTSGVFDWKLYNRYGHSR
jgi:hypothetical protein